MRLVDAHKIRCERDDFDTYADYIKAFDAINEAPTVDAVPARHGRWMYSCVYGKVEWVCNQCEQDANTKTKYCPHCGARMDSE